MVNKIILSTIFMGYGLNWILLWTLLIPGIVIQIIYVCNSINHISESEVLKENGKKYFETKNIKFKFKVCSNNFYSIPVSGKTANFNQKTLLGSTIFDHFEIQYKLLLLESNSVYFSKWFLFKDLFLKITSISLVLITPFSNFIPNSWFILTLCFSIYWLFVIVDSILWISLNKKLLLKVWDIIYSENGNKYKDELNFAFKFQKKWPLFYNLSIPFSHFIKIWYFLSKKESISI